MTRFTTTPRGRRLALRTTGAAVLLALGAVTAHAQSSRNTSTSDSASFIVPRRGPQGADRALATRDGDVALILRDSVVVLQLTDDGMRRLFANDTVSRGVGGAMAAAIVRAGVSEMMNHGIAYRLSALRGAHASGSRLVLESRDGTHVFEDASLNGRRPMTDFHPAEAERFAAVVRRAIAAR